MQMCHYHLEQALGTHGKPSWVGRLVAGGSVTLSSGWSAVVAAVVATETTSTTDDDKNTKARI